MPISKITKKGQVTLPVKFRKKFKTNYVSVDIIDDLIIISPAMSLGGVFQKYAQRGKSAEEIMQRERKDYEDAIREKHHRNRR